MNKVKLINYPDDIIYRGMVLRCKGKYPYEEIVDFLFCETCDDITYQLIVISGYKAGLRYCLLPKLALRNENGAGVSKKWLVDNWYNWGYIDCDISDVYIFQSPVPSEYP
jgi:Immunity protein 45